MSLAELDDRTGFDYVELFARETPDRIAITGPGRQRSWSQFHTDAKRFAQKLGKLGLNLGQIVVVSHSDPYIHWLVLLACDCLGLVSASLSPDDGTDSELLDLADLLLTEERIGSIVAGESKATGELPRARAASDRPVRILRTSGSTGTPKCMMIHRQAQNHRIASIIARNGFGPTTRLYVAYPFSVNLNYYRAEACLRQGGTVIFGRASQDLIAYDATHCWLLPRDMVILLDGIRGTWPAPGRLNMSLGGGPVSAALHDRTASTLGTKVPIQYGTNETGFIGVQDRDGVCTVWPENDLKIVDECGRVVPPGEAGRILARGPGMVMGYLNDPEASEAHFREGWFLTDDIGALLSDGRFRLLGRHSEILNLGGFKLMLGAVEDALRTHISGIREVAVTSLPNAQDIEELCIAVVPDGSASQPALFAAVQAVLPPTYGKFWLLCLDKLPVGASGKVQRSVLKDVFTAAQSPRR